MSTKEICRVLIGLLSLAAFVAIASCSEDGPNGPLHPRLKLVLPELRSTDCSTVAVPMTVEGFSEVAGFEIHVRYESQYATYDSMTSTYTSGATVNEAARIIHFVWADIGNALTASNGDTLAMIHMSDLTDTCRLTFEPNTEVVNIEGDPFDVDLEDGSIECSEP